MIPSLPFPQELKEKVHTEIENSNDYVKGTRTNGASVTIETTQTSYFVPLAPTYPSKAHFSDECVYIPENNDTMSEESSKSFDKREVVVIDTEYDRGNPKQAKILQIGWKSEKFAKQYYVTPIRHIERKSFAYFKLGLSTSCSDNGFKLLKNKKVVNTTPIKCVLKELFLDLKSLSAPAVAAHGIGDFQVLANGVCDADLGYQFENGTFDTIDRCRILQRLVGPRGKYNIKYIADTYGFELQHHQALDDATVLYRFLTETDVISSAILKNSRIPFYGYNFL